MAIDKFDGDYRFLSNFWEVAINYEGSEWPSSEHAYQAAKFTDSKIRERIRKFPQPAKAKKLGRGIGLRADWEDIKLSIMADIVKAKFDQHSELKEKLLKTGDQELIEGNWWGDTFWGKCSGTGENHLGKILMNLRESYRNDHSNGH